MNDKMNRNIKKAINKVFRKYSVRFAYATPSTQYNSDLGINQKQENHYQSIDEPLFPNNSSTTNQIQSSNGGSIQQYSYAWVSRLKLPMRTTVKYHDMYFSIIDKADYQDIAGIYEYYLRGRSDLHD